MTYQCPVDIATAAVLFDQPWDSKTAGMPSNKRFKPAEQPFQQPMITLFFANALECDAFMSNYKLAAKQMAALKGSLIKGIIVTAVVLDTIRIYAACRAGRPSSQP